MDTKTLIQKSKPRLIEVASLLINNRTKEAYASFGSLLKDMAIRDSRLTNLMAGLVVSSVRAQQNPKSFEDPLTAFEDPLTAFEDPLTAFEDPLTAFDDKTMQRLTFNLINI